MLDDLDDVATLSSVTKGALSTLVSSTGGANPTTVDINTTSYNYSRQSVTFSSYVELSSVTVGLTYDAGGTSGLLRLDVYKGEDITNAPSSTLWNTVRTNLGTTPVLSSYGIQASAATGSPTFTFPSNNVLSPNVTYTIVVWFTNLDASMALQLCDTTVTGQFANVPTKDLSLSISGYVLSGTPVTNDLLKYDADGGGVWEAEAAYPTSGYVPLQVMTRDPVVADVYNSGVFWRNSLTEQVWLSRGAGLWWAIDPNVPYTLKPTVATRSDTAPSSPTTGKLWFSNTTGRLSVYDQEATAWIEI